MYDIIQNIQTKDDFVEFLHEFAYDAKNNEKEYSSIRLNQLLFSMIRYFEVLEHQHQNEKIESFETNPSWSTIAELLFAAAIRD